MKTRTKKLGLLLIISSVLTMIGSFIITGMIDSSTAFVAEATDQYKDVEQVLSDVSTLYLSELFNDVEVKPSTDQKVRVKYYGAKEIEITQTEQKVEITGNDRPASYTGFYNGKWQFGIQWWNHRAKNTKLEIYVPSSVKTLDVKNSVLKLDIQNIALDHLSIKQEAGDIEITDSTIAKTVTLDAKAANVEIESLLGNATLDVSVSIGNFELHKSHLNEAKIMAGVGHVEIEDIIIGTLDITGGIGNIKVKDSTIQTLQGSQDIGTFEIEHNNVTKNLLGSSQRR